MIIEKETRKNEKENQPDMFSHDYQSGTVVWGWSEVKSLHQTSYSSTLNYNLLCSPALSHMCKVMYAWTHPPLIMTSHRSSLYWTDADITLSWGVHSCGVVPAKHTHTHAKWPFILSGAWANTHLADEGGSHCLTSTLPPSQILNRKLITPRGTNPVVTTKWTWPKSIRGMAECVAISHTDGSKIDSTVRT